MSSGVVLPPVIGINLPEFGPRAFRQQCLQLRSRPAEFLDKRGPIDKVDGYGYPCISNPNVGLQRYSFC